MAVDREITIGGSMYEDFRGTSLLGEASSIYIYHALNMLHMLPSKNSD